jgi:Flp pilus assembly protein TadD
LEEGLQIHPDNIGARNGLGFIFFKQGRAGEAEAEFRKVLELQSNNVEAQNNLAWILATCPGASLRNGTRAVELAQRANQLSAGSNPAILATLAAAYAEVGSFSQAVATANEALKFVESSTNTIVTDALRAQISCYEKNAPFRDSSLTNTRAATQ